MKLLSAHSLSSFWEFMLRYNKSIFFTALFYSLWILTSYLNQSDFDLKHFDGRMIGYATFHSIDIGARVSLFYKALSLLLISFLTFNGIAYLLYNLNNSILKSVELQFINYCSLGGIVYYLFYLFGYTIDNSIEFIYFLHKVMIAAFIFKLYFKTPFSISLYVVLLSIATSAYFIFSDLFILSIGVKMPDFLMSTFIIAQLFILFLHVKIRNRPLMEQRAICLRLAYFSSPLLFAPFLSVLKDEIQLIFIGNGLQVNTSLVIYLLLLLLIGLFVYLRVKRLDQKPHVLESYSLRTILAKQHFPILVFSIIAFTMYHPFMNDSVEMSESANRYLPIMEFKNWGIVPMFEKLNSHLLSDIFFSSIYAFFNDFKTNEIELYDFLYAACVGLLYYYLIYFLTRNAYVALFTILFYPFFTEILPDGHAVAVLSIFILYKVIEQKPSTKNYLILLSGAAFLVFWRIDIGTACLPTMILLLATYPKLRTRVTFDFKKLFKAFLIVTITILSVILYISFSRNINILEKAKNALNYFSSAQTYGYIYIADTTQQSYTLHYFLFPLIAAVLFLVLFYKFRFLNTSKKQRLSFISLFVMIGYYFMNFQRGLIRHSLYEGNDTFVSSFIYIILAGSIYVFFSKTSHVFKFISFNTALFFLMVNYKCPKPTNSVTIVENTFKKFGTYQLPILKSGDSRSIDFDQSQYRDVVGFLNSNLDSTQTFIDFTNTPMVFYYTHKITPSYFYQNPICSHNDYLQNTFINDLKNYKTPYLLFARLVDGENTTDGVTNCFRHYRMAEYFYNHYQPHVIKDQYCVWIKKGVTNNLNNRVLYSIKPGETDSLDLSNGLSKTFDVSTNKKYLIKLVAKQAINTNAFRAQSNGIELANNYVFTTANASVAYCELVPLNELLHIQLHDLSNILELTITECVHIPDYRSEKYMAYTIFKLPYIWGTYDKTYNEEHTLVEESKHMQLLSKEATTTSFSPDIDKTSGNTVVLSLKNNSDKVQKMNLSFSGPNGLPESTVTFDLIVSPKNEVYAIRISSMYNWYKSNINQITLSSLSEASVEISKIKITKGL